MKLYFSTLYLAVTLLVVGGCAKKTEEPIPAPNTLPKPAVDIQQSQKLFLANGYDKKLTELVLNADHTKGTRLLTPLWDKARQRDTPPAAACAYIPLAHTVTMINTQDYLLVAKTTKGLYFSVASYIYDPSKVNQLSPNDPSFFTTFTGTVLIKSLATGEITRATYQNGTLTPSVTLPTKGTNPNTLSQVCDYFTTCYYTGYEPNSYVTLGYVSSALGSSCLPPGFGAPTGFYSTISWTLTSSSSNYQCEETGVDGPNPLPPPPSTGGGSSDTSANGVSSVTITAQGPKINPVAETRCFNVAQGAKLTVYVQEAKQGTRDKVGPAQVGHTFVGIEQNGITRYMGYYPQSTANSALVAVGASYPGELHDNSGSAYDVSITAFVSASQFASMIQYINNYPATYNLNSYNCADFGIAVANLGGMNLPATTTRVALFDGRSPGDLGEDIRAMPNNGYINKTGGYALSKQGTCP